MSFVSFQFAVFFVVVSLAYQALPHRFRWIWLIVASCWFYMALIPAYILILFALIAIDYRAGIWLEKAQDQNKKRWILIGSLAANLGMLATFKYLNFFLGNISDAMGAFGMGSIAWRFPLLLPIGLSFHTFQSMAYTVEVYQGHRKAERHIGIYSLYVLFYPQMVAGPIERPQNLLDQFHKKTVFNASEFIAGLQLMLWGFAKKVLVADRLSTVVEKAYADPGHQSSWMLLLATVFFGFQIYCDFSGYTDIARGIARTMGYKLMLNFNHPYSSRSPMEFWHRWHISLSTWFRDYLYFPLGGSKGGFLKTSRNIMLVFLLSGLWHGANWTFLVWGGLHGIYIVTQRLLMQTLGKTSAWLNMATKPLIQIGMVISTFVLMDFAWIFFRATDMHAALSVIHGIFSGYNLSQLGLAFSETNVRIGIALIIGLEVLQYLHRKRSMLIRLEALPLALSWALWYVLIVALIVFGKFGNEEFLYFRF